MEYAETSVGQRVQVVPARYYSDAYVGLSGEITSRYDGVDGEHGTVEVKLDGVAYPPSPPGWMDYTHMGVEQLEPAPVPDPECEHCEGTGRDTHDGAVLFDCGCIG